MISGYMLFDGKGVDASRVKRKIRDMFILFVFYETVFVLMDQIYHFYIGDFPVIPPKKEILLFITTGHWRFAVHLWYLHAYIIVLALVLIIERFRLWRIYFILVPVLIVSSLVIAEYNPLYTGHTYHYYLCANYFLIGLPYFGLGAIIKKYAGCLVRPVYAGRYFLAAAVSLAVGYFEIVFFRSRADNFAYQYTNTAFAAVFVFLTALCIPMRKENLIARMGRRDSRHIYILHWTVFYICAFIPFSLGPLLDYSRYYFSALALVTTIGITHLLRYIGIIDRGALKKIKVFEREKAKTLG